MPKDIAFMLKVVCIILIAMSPFLPYASLPFLNNIVFKIACLFLILGVCFYDFQLALLITILFMLMVLNMNQVVLTKVKPELFSENLKQNTQRVIPNDDPIPNEQPLPNREESPILSNDLNLVCSSSIDNDINEDMMTYYIDEKIKPYDVFIKMMTNDDALRAAQGDF